jgi:chromosome segregation protein
VVDTHAVRDAALAECRVTVSAQRAASRAAADAVKLDRRAAQAARRAATRREEEAIATVRAASAELLDLTPLVAARRQAAAAKRAKAAAARAATDAFSSKCAMLQKTLSRVEAGVRGELELEAKREVTAAAREAEARVRHNIAVLRSQALAAARRAAQVTTPLFHAHRSVWLPGAT